MNRKLVSLLALPIYAAIGIALLACQVPVFRYALERWPADTYQILILHDQPLQAEQKGWLKGLQDEMGSLPGPGEPAERPRVQLIDVDINKAKDPRLVQLWRSQASESPLLVAAFPSAATTPANGFAYSGPLNAQSGEQLLRSPARTEIAKRLKQGHSAVWVLLESGDAEQDQHALETLEKQLAADERRLELPSAEELEVDAAILQETKIQLRIAFSVLRVKRDDPREEFLVSSLLNSESDLKEFDAPLAFPIFGRGRVLYALVGKGIAEDTIRMASDFIVGPCSCQVKEQNPGFDLLMIEDWEAAVGDNLISAPIPTVSGQGREPRLLTIPPGRASR